jgi:hypothetical protein
VYVCFGVGGVSGAGGHPLRGIGEGLRGQIKNMMPVVSHKQGLRLVLHPLLDIGYQVMEEWW